MTFEEWVVGEKKRVKKESSNWLRLFYRITVWRNYHRSVKTPH